jgi:hypothetical protein
MDPVSLKPWLDIMTQNGLPWVVCVLMILLLWKYIPAWLDASIASQREMPKAINALVKEIRHIKATSYDSHDDIADVKLALRNAAHVGEQLLLQHGRNRDSDVVVQMRQIHQSMDEDKVDRYRRRQRDVANNGGDSEPEPEVA